MQLHTIHTYIHKCINTYIRTYPYIYNCNFIINKLQKTNKQTKNKQTNKNKQKQTKQKQTKQKQTKTNKTNKQK